MPNDPKEQIKNYWHDHIHFIESEQTCIYKLRNTKKDKKEMPNSCVFVRTIKQQKNNG